MLTEARIGGMVGDGAATLVARAFAATDVPAPPDALDRFLAIYDARLLKHTRPYPRDRRGARAARRARASLAVLTNKPLGATREILAVLDLARHFPESSVLGGDGPFARKPEPGGLRHLASAGARRGAETLLVGDSVIDWRTARAASTSDLRRPLRLRLRRFPSRASCATGERRDRRAARPAAPVAIHTVSRLYCRASLHRSRRQLPRRKSRSQPVALTLLRSACPSQQVSRERSMNDIE